MEQGKEFCDLFGPEIIDYSLMSEFVGYFLPKKINQGYDASKKQCAAALNFYKWLVRKGLTEEEDLPGAIRYLRDTYREGWEQWNGPVNEEEDY